MLPKAAGAKANPIGYELSQRIPVNPAAVHERTIIVNPIPLQSPPSPKKQVAPPSLVSAQSLPSPDLISILDKQLESKKPVMFVAETGRYHIERKLGQGGMGGVYIATSLVENLKFPEEALDTLAKAIAKSTGAANINVLRKELAGLGGWTLADWYDDYVSRGAISGSHGVEQAVLEAIKSDLNDKGCLKIAAQGREMRKGLETEIAIAKGMTTQFMAPIKGVARRRKSGEPAVFYTLVDGHDICTLRHTLMACGQLLPVELTALFGNHAAQGLLPFHQPSQGRPPVCHGDICDKNVMISGPEGCAKILDFGMAGEHSLAEKGMIAGKPMWIAPDILQAASANYGTSDQNKTRISPEQHVAADVWALGALLYLLLTGMHPYPDRQDGKKQGVREYLFWKQLITDRETYMLLKPHEVCADVPETLSEIVHSMLDPDWQRRPTISEFESRIKTHYLFNGFMGTGVSMQSWRSWLDRLYPAPKIVNGKKMPRYTATDLAKDVRNHPELVNLKQVLLGTYRIPFYEQHGITWTGDNGWARTFDVKQYPDIEHPDAQKGLYTRLRGDLSPALRVVCPTGIDYTLRRCIRTVEGAIGPCCGDLLYEMFQKRLADRAFQSDHDTIRRHLAAVDDGATPYGVFRDLAVDVLAQGQAPIKAKDGRDITRKVLETKADRYLFDLYSQAIELHPKKRD